MKFLEVQAVIGAAVLLLSTPVQAKHSHRSVHLDHLDKRHAHSRRTIHASPSADVEGAGIELRDTTGQCTFPTNAGLVAVTPGSENAGWAMSPNQPCKPGNYCPYACPPGQVMAQWDPTATSYTYPKSMNGGLYCDSTGAISKPFPDKAYCVAGTGTVGVQNNCGKVVAVCQTVLPGNEAMLIPTSVDSYSQLAVPDTSYWCSTAAHYYINPPGYSTTDACLWSDGSLPIGNWSPYVGGANTDANGNTFVKLAWNPIYLEPTTSFRNVLPTYGVKIVCIGGGCNGLPCSIDPAVNGINQVTSSLSATGAGGGDFCVVTVPKGSSANIVVFNAGNSDGGSSSSSKSSSKAASSTSATPTPTPTPSSTSTSTTSSAQVSTTSSSSSSSSSQSSSSSSSSSTTISSTSSSSSSSSSSVTTSFSSSISSSSSSTLANSPHVFVENATSTASRTSATTTPSVTLASSAAAAATSTKSAAANTVVSSTFGLSAIIALALGYML